MRDLVQSATLGRAALAALVSTLLCLPRLGFWESATHHLTLLVLTLAICSFVLWGFVFAWCPLSMRPVMTPRWTPLPWTLATVGGLAAAGLLAAGIDPSLRALRPDDYPQSVNQWLAHWLFGLSLSQLFLCFAPLCFFYRLFHSVSAAVTATVLFGVFLLGLQLQQAEPMSLGFHLSLLGARVLLGTGASLIFVHGGPWPVWWLATLTEARELPRLLGLL